MKPVLAAVIVIAVAFFTFPFWASCNLKYEACLKICDVQHFSGGIEKAACKGKCTSKKIQCISLQAIEPSSTGPGSGN